MASVDSSALKMVMTNYDLSGMSSALVREELPDWLDDMFAISETMAEYESEADYEEEE